MNIVVLCKKWNHKKVLEILEALRQQELRVRGLVALAKPLKKNTVSDMVHKMRMHGLQRFAANGAANLNGAISSNDLAPPATKFSPNGQQHVGQNHSPCMTIAEYAGLHQIEMITVPDLNSAECAAALESMNTDILLLGGVPIIRANVLAVPKVCTLNVHMALLPKFRGMNVAEWSIYCSAPVGVTVHQVEPGVDTGAILFRETIEVADCHDIIAMRTKVSKEQHLALAQCTRWLVDEKLVPTPQKKEEGKQFYIMHPKLKKVVEHRLAKDYKAESFTFAKIELPST